MDYTDNSIYNDPHYRLYGTLTGYRLLVIGFSTLYTLYRLVLLVFGWHLIPVVPELAVVAVLVIGLAWLGLYASADPPVYPGLFQANYVVYAKPYLRSIVAFFLAFTMPLGMAGYIGFAAWWITACWGVADIFVSKFMGGYFLVALVVWSIEIIISSLTAQIAFRMVVDPAVLKWKLKIILDFVYDRRAVQPIYNAMDTFSALSGGGLFVTWLVRSLFTWWVDALHAVAPTFEHTT